MNIDTWITKIRNEIKNFQNNIPYDNNNIIKRQMDNVNPKFFNRKELYEFSIDKFDYIKELFTHPKWYLLNICMLYTDIYTITRIFRDFKNKGHLCDKLSNTSQNIILYGGNSHIENIQEFIQNYVLNRTFPKDYDYFGLNQEKESSNKSSNKYMKPYKSSKYGPTHSKKKLIGKKLKKDFGK